MPVRRYCPENSKGNNVCYYRWGQEKKYYFDPNDSKAEEFAREKAARQGRAIKASQMRHLSHSFHYGGNKDEDYYMYKYKKYKSKYLNLK